MKLFRRNKGSTFNKAAIDIEFYLNYVGQNGVPDLIFQSKREYFTIQFENPKEVEELICQAHIVARNYNEERS